MLWSPSPKGRRFVKAEAGSGEVAGGALPLVGAGTSVAARPFARIAKNFAFLALAGGIVGGGYFVLNVLLARSFHTLYHLGVGFLIIRDVARDKGLAARALGAGLTLSLTLGLLSLGLIALVATFGGYSSSTRTLILILAIAQLPYTLMLLCQSIFRAFERMELEPVVSFLSTATLLALVLLLLSRGGGVLMIGVAHLAASLVGLYAAAFTLTAPIGFVADSAANAIFPPLAAAFTSSQRLHATLGVEN